MGGWGYREGVDPLLQSQLYPPRPGQDRWLQPHRPVSKSQEAARDPGTECYCPAPSLGHHHCWGCLAQSWSHPCVVAGSMARPLGAHLVAGRARPGAAGHPVRCRSAPRQRPRPRTPPGQARSEAVPRLAGRPSGRKDPPRALTLQARWACTATLPRRQAGPPCSLMVSTWCRSASTRTCRVPAPQRRPGQQRDNALRAQSSGLPGGLTGLVGTDHLTWVSEAQVVPKGQAGGLGQGLVLL